MMNRSFGTPHALGVLKSEKNLATVMRMIRGEASVRAELVRRSVAEVRRLNRTIRAAESRLKERIASNGTTLHECPGIGPMLAAKILGEVGDPSKLRSAAGFARLSGVAPIPASSGQVVRYRLDRKGNRALNRSLHMIAVVRCRIDPDTKAYMAKKRAEGKSGKEAMRCLKRHIANHVYRRMQADCRRSLREIDI